ncbi:MAG: beta-propeller fold lactonase family protein, partial [Thermoanaerobaculia bacterium]
HLYVVNATGNNGIAVFGRSSTPGPTFGQLTFIENDSGGGACGANAIKSATSVAVSPDGAHVYVTARPSGSSNVLTAWSRDNGTGQLSCIQKILDNTNLRRASGLSVSSDGTTVYATATSAKQERITAFSRDTGSGLLTFLQSIKDGTGGANSLSGPTATVVGAGDGNVYVTAGGDNAITRFTRNIAGSLSAPLALVDNVAGADGLAGASFLALSPDGKNAYTAAPGEDEIGIFARNVATGALAFVGVQANLVGPITGLDGITGLAVSPNGAYVVGAANLSSALSVFARNPATGALAFVAAITDPGNLDGARAVAASPDGKCVYVAAQTANNVEAYCFTGRDFGDAPGPYRTLEVNGGPRHSIGAAAFLGAGVPDAESDGQPSALANGDDLTGSDDEEGATPPASPILPGQTTTFMLTGAGVFDGWIDFNGDGDFNDSGEQIYFGAIIAGTTFESPALIADGFTIARFRARPLNSAPLFPEGGGGDGEVEDYLVELSANSFQVSVSKNGNGSGTVASSPTGLDCGTTCTAPFAENADVTLTATPAAGTDFTGWSGPAAGECSGSSCTFTNLTANKAVIATFTLQTFTLNTAVASGNGTIEDVPQADIQCGTGGASCAALFDYNTQVQLTAMPDSGWIFTGWTGDCTNVIGDCVVTMTQARSVQATFALGVFLFTVDPEAGNGTGTVRITNTDNATFIDCRPEVPADPDCTHFYTGGTHLSLAATPDADSFFSGWTTDCSGTGACTLTMAGPHTVG